MKIKKAMRILAVLVIFSILLATTIFAAPARASAYLSAYYATITKTSTGDLSIHFQVIAPAIMDQLGAKIYWILLADRIQFYIPRNTGTAKQRCWNLF